MSIEVDTERFYSLLRTLSAHHPQGSALKELDRRAVPKRGVYFFREPTEARAKTPSELRVVRVGTHAVSSGARASLWSRLAQHRGTRAGNGNHRGSIFRRHVGAALLARDGLTIETWGCGSSAPSQVKDNPELKDRELACEQRVSAFIGSMSVLWVDVPDDPGPASLRASIERNAIALLSNRMAPSDRASAAWLGNYSTCVEIRNSSLWNVNYVRDGYDPLFLNELEAAVARTLGGASLLASAERG